MTGIVINFKESDVYCTNILVIIRGVGEKLKVKKDERSSPTYCK